MGTRSIRWWWLAALLALFVTACDDDDTDDTDDGTQAAGIATDTGGDDESDGDGDGEIDGFERVEEATVTDLTYGGAGLRRWLDEVPRIADVRVRSTIDDYEQPVLWLPHEEDEPRPLLVVLHSWSVDYLQHLGIPYALWADEQGWAMIHPDFRGVHDSEESTGSDRTIQDVIDAIDWAAEHAPIDTDRVFVTGFSGGGMMALNLVGQHPDRFAGAVAWVPIYDLVAWYHFAPGLAYARQIENSCGGAPILGTDAQSECSQRSPSHHLDAAREAGVPVYIGHGTEDTVVPPVHAGWAFNHLADADDRLSDDELAALESISLPGELDGAIEAETYFHAPDPDVRFARQSDNVTLVLFESGHAAVYNPGLEWMVNVADDEHAD